MQILRTVEEGLSEAVTSLQNEMAHLDKIRDTAPPPTTAFKLSDATRLSRYSTYLSLKEPVGIE